MSTPLAPTRSARPVPRVTPDERRARETAMAEQFAALEARADMDPYLADDPLARLGYRDYGGLAAVDYVPDGRNAAHLPRGVTGPRGLTRTEIRALQTLQPERVSAWENRESDYLVPPRSVLVGSEVNAPAVLAHEFRHGGVDILDQLLENDPALQEQYSELRGGDEWRSSRADRWGYTDFNESVTEVQDDPTAWWNTSSGERATMAPYIQYYDPEDDIWDGVRRYEAAYQTIAAEELARRGEPPRAVMQQPQPGNMFYREPEPEPRGGLLGLLDRIRGN